MSNSVVILERCYPFHSPIDPLKEFGSRNPISLVLLHSSSKRMRMCRLCPSAKRGSRKKRTWWQRFFLDEDDYENWFEDEIEGTNDEDTEIEGEEVSDKEKFEEWKRRAEAISELQEMREDVKNSERRAWEDWVGDGSSSASTSKSSKDWQDDWNAESSDDIPFDPVKLSSKRGKTGAIRDIVFGDSGEDEWLLEDRIFQYASSSSAKFLAVLVIIPMALDFVVHDFVLMPFLDRYVKIVPLAAKLLDVRTSQKGKMIEALKFEKARYRFEVEIGKAPPLSEEELWWEMRHKALEMRDEWRLENRKAFASIWSDMVFGIALFIILYLNKSKVALMKFTGYKILKNVSDTGKAFIIILLADIFVGYHSEPGWRTVLEIIADHYGVEQDEAAVTIFVAVVPVVVDACLKLWLFKILPKLSPAVSNIIRAMKRH